MLGGEHARIAPRFAPSFAIARADHPAVFQIPHVVRGVLGGVLELVIHSVERLRDHAGTLSQR
jgi:hypothetical protein